MWVEALDILLEVLKSKLDFSKVVAISGSGQQHGSVYWKKGSSAMLASLDPSKPLLSQLENSFSTKESPIWMNSSTSSQCREIEKTVGGALELSKLTGSRAYERFTGPQIRKLYEKKQDIYNETERISLVSYFMASLFIGGYASIDETDAAGMNLMDIRERVWSKIVLEATAPGLEEKLGKLAPAHAVAGSVALYFVERYHFKDSCLVIQWSGDNPNSLAVGFHRFVIDNFTGNSLDEKVREVEEFDAPSEVRAIIEGLFLSMRGHAERFGMPTPPIRIIATGGASSNESILSSISSIFGCPVYTVQSPDSASLGAALRAAHENLCPYQQLYSDKFDKTSLCPKLAMPAGDKDLRSRYALLVKKRMEIEKDLVESLGGNKEEQIL